MKRMNTESLVKSILHYPLNYIILFYDDPMDAVRYVEKNSLIHTELRTRHDAPEHIADIFETTSIDLNIGCEPYLSYSSIKYEDELFLEYYIAYNLATGAFTQETKNRIANTARVKFEERSTQPETYSDLSIQPLRMILSQLGEDVGTSTSSMVSSTGNITVYTMFGQTIMARMKDEVSAREIERRNLVAQVEHPNAVLAANSSEKYNCHSYAWHNRSSTNDVWINALDNNFDFQLSKYWISDYYVPSTQEGAELIFYSNNLGSEHSGVLLPSGQVISKWAEGPLMIHDIDDCPFMSENLLYFKPRTDLPLNYISITGPDHVSPGQTALFTRATRGGNVTYTWSVESYPGELNYNLPTINDNYTRDTAQITFYNEGYYIVRVEVSALTPDLQNTTLFYGQKYILVY